MSPSDPIVLLVWYFTYKRCYFQLIHNMAKIHTPFLPPELQDKCIMDNVPVPVIRQIDKRCHEMIGSVPSNAWAFLTDVENWTVESILKHIDETKGWAEAGLVIDSNNVYDAIERAVQAHANPMPLVVRVLYKTEPIFLRTEQCTFMFVQPIVNTLPWLAYGNDGTELGMMFYGFDSPGVVNFDPAKGYEPISEDGWISDPDESPPPTEVADFLATRPWAWYEKTTMRRPIIRRNNLHVGWQKEAGPEPSPQQKALLERLKENITIFCKSRPHELNYCKDLLLKALWRNERWIDPDSSESRKGETELPQFDFPLNVPVYIRDVCV